MKSTENQQKGSNENDFIKRVQQIFVSNEIQSLASNIKKIMAQADVLDKTVKSKILEINKAVEREKEAKNVKPEPIIKSKIETIKPAESIPPQVAPSVSIQKKPQEIRQHDGKFSENRPAGKPQGSNNENFGTRTRNFNVNDDSRKRFTPRTDNRTGGFQPNERQNDGGGARSYAPRSFDRPAGTTRPQTGFQGSGTGFKKPETTSFTKPQFFSPSSDTRGPSRKKTADKGHDEKKSMNKRALIMRGFVEDESLVDENGKMGSKRKQKKKENPTFVAPRIENSVITTENLTVKLLAEKIGKPVSVIMKKFLLLGIMVNINSSIDFASAELIASELGVKLEQKIEKTYEEKLSDIATEIDDEKDLKKRPPVVTVLGHVDHGKTSLLDYIRDSNVIVGEAGGITQHIGAYTIEVKNELITFIDTPGHAAFTSMRERGAKLTDIAILVVAADDGVMPQTIEAIKHIRQVNVPMIVAINKIDKPVINIERVKQQLTENGVIPEEWGGDAIIVPIAAKTGLNIDKLLEMILFVAEYQNLRANPNRKAVGSIIEAKLDKGQGPVATVLVQNGTLKVGDNIVAGTTSGKIRAMFNEKGQRVRTAGPSFAVSVLGLADVPSAGDEIYAVDDKLSKKVLSERKVKEKTDMIKSMDVSVDALMSRMKEIDYKFYNVIIKADVQGSVEALTQTLSELQNEEVKVKCIHGGVGAVNENDVMLAQASNALIVTFNTKQDFNARILIEKYKIEVINSKIIYEVVDFINKKIDSMLTPKYREVVTGHAEIRVVFKASKVGAIAGSYILDGKLTRNQGARVLRNGKEIYLGSIATIQREKNEVRDISAGFECGIVLSNFSAIEVGDVIEAFAQERIN